MPKVSINILTKNRAELLKKALASMQNQSLKDFEVVVVNDGSTDETADVLKDLKFKDLKIIDHPQSIGITLSRQEALEKSAGEYVAVLDDDDEWVDLDKLKKQVEYLDTNPDVVICGGGIQVERFKDLKIERFRPQTDLAIRQTMLIRNNFFTSTVMFRKGAAVKVGGFIKEDIDLAEEYDLWLRMGQLGKMYNFPEVFTAYRSPSYNKDKFRLFLQKQRNLIKKHRNDYPWAWLAVCILKFRILFVI